MKAIILAAGEGIRLRPYTLDKPKVMVSYRGRPILDYQLEAMTECGIRDIVVVTGYCGSAVCRSGIRKIDNPDFATTNMVYSLFCAESEMTDDMIISYGDIVYGSALLQSLVSAPYPLATTIDLNWRELWTSRMEDPLKDAETLQLAPDGRIIELGKKPKSYTDIQGQYMGLIKMDHTVIENVKAFYHAMDRTAIYDGKKFESMFMTSFLQELIDTGFNLMSVPIRGGWIEIDNLKDLDVQVDLK